MHAQPGIAAVVITYHPPAQFVKNVLSYASFVDVVYVFDNSYPAADLQSLQNNSNIQVITNGENLGIAANLNKAASMGMKAGYRWLLTMDQDSCFAAGAFEQYLRCVRAYGHFDAVAQFGPAYGLTNKETQIQCEGTRVDNLITSGSLLNLTHFEAIGRFDEHLFIDLVDIDYCIRARAAGLQLVRFNNVFLQHNLGHTVRRASIKTAFLKKKLKQVHNPLRCYYIFRNMLYLCSKLEATAPDAVKDMRSTVKGVLKVNFFYGRFSGKMMSYLIKAKKDYAAGRMGRIQEA